MNNLGEWILLFPSTWKYSIDQYHNLENSSEYYSQLNSEIKDKWLSDISYLKVDNIYLCFPLSSSDFSFTIKIEFISVFW